MTSDERPIFLAHLARRAVRDAYTDLNQLLLSVTEKDDLNRKRELLDFCLRLRHYFARLLVATRWGMKFGSSVDKAITAEDLADDREFSFEDAADRLWSVHRDLRAEPMPKLALAAAVNALGRSDFPKLPTKVESRMYTLSNGSIGDPSASSTRAGTMPHVFPSSRRSRDEALGAATRNILHRCLTQLDGLHIFDWRAGSDNTCVSLGVVGAWCARLRLDNLDTSVAVFRIQSIKILVASEKDAPGSWALGAQTGDFLSSSYKVPSLSQETMLMYLAKDRMIEAAKRSTGTRTARALAMLEALRGLMTDEFCSSLAIEYLRAHARSLVGSTWRNYLQIEGHISGNVLGAPLVLCYWKDSRDSSKIEISRVRRTRSLKRPCDGLISHEHGELISIKHDPPLPGAHACQDSTSGIVPSSLNVESVLLMALKSRTVARLVALSESILRQREQLKLAPDLIRLKNDKDDANGPSLTVWTQARSSGIEFRVSLRTGALKARPFGAAALACSSNLAMKSEIWKGSRHFRTVAEEEASVVSALDAVVSRVRLDAAARSVCALDIGVSHVLPPGTAWVAGSAPSERLASQLAPPFAPLARKDSTRFLTLSFAPPPSKKRYGLPAGKTTSPPRGMYRNVGANLTRLKLTSATTRDGLVFIQETDSLGGRSEKGDVDLRKYDGTAAAAVHWAVTHEAVERRLRRDSLLRAFNTAHVASNVHQLYPQDEDDILQYDTASRTLLKVKSEPLPLRRAELLLRGSDAWQVRLSLLPSIFDDTDSVFPRQRNSIGRPFGGYGTSWTFGVACVGSTLTFTYPSANAASVRSFFKDLTRARTAAALARGVPESQFFGVLRRSPVRIIVALGPYAPIPYSIAVKPLYHATVEYVYSKGNSGGFSMSFDPPKPTMKLLAPLIEEALDSSGGAVGLILAGLLERACPVAAAAESAVCQRGGGRIRFVTALRVRAVFTGFPRSMVNAYGGKEAGAVEHVHHAVDLDARGSGGFVTVIDVGRATAVMIAQGFARGGGSSGSSTGGSRKSEFFPLPKWDQIVASLSKDGSAMAQRSGSTAVLKMEALEKFLSMLVTSARYSS